ncbi:MAG: calcium/sodium antiporter [Pseudomonadota bacterium]
MMLFFVIAGLAVLLISGDILVRGAVGLAKLLNIPPLLIGMTIVAFGTSAPELVVTVKAVLAGEAGIAVGNIIGSNIANVLLVLGLPAIIYPIACSVDGLKRNAVIMLIATALFSWFAFQPGAIDFNRGAFLFALIVAFVAYSGLRMRSGGQDEAEELEELEDAPSGAVRIGVYIIVGLIGLPIGAQLLVDNAALLAAQLGVRDELIGLTIIAFGTSLPELATVVAAAMRKHSAVALGNVVGSNLFNLLAVGGAAGLAGGAAFSPAAQMFDVPVMIACTILVSGFIFLRGTINRMWGVLFSIAYFAYIGVLAQGALAG